MIRILPVSSTSFQTTYLTQSIISTGIIAVRAKFIKTFLPQDLITPHSLSLLIIYKFLILRISSSKKPSFPKTRNWSSPPISLYIISLL